MVINQGDIFWVDLRPPAGSGPGYRHPLVVIQNNVFNRSLINTIIGCALTSNLERGNANFHDGQEPTKRAHRVAIQAASSPDP